jgi:hypothetical protein
MGLFGVDANKVQQSSISAQATSQEGTVFGAVTGKGSVGAASSGNILGGIAAGAHSTINVQTPDAAAIAAVSDIAHSNAALSLAALQANQDLSTLSVSYANQNANTALETLQQLGTQLQIGAVGGTASDIADVAGTYTGDSPAPASNTGKIVIAVIAIAAVTALVFFYKR